MNDVTEPRQRPAPTDLRAEWARLRATMPEAVEAAVTPELWDIERLHTLALPVQDVPVRDLAWLLYVPLWAVDGMPFQVSPNSVRERPDAFAAQYERTMASDLAWPIHIMQFRGRWIILDGVHRLLKADMLGYPAIRAMVLGRDTYDSILYLRDDE